MAVLGSGAYVPGFQPTPSAGFAAGPASVTGGGADPFTGTKARQRLSHIPARNFYMFDAAPKPDAIGGKIREFSSGLSASADTADLALSEAEVAPGGVLDALLTKYGLALPPMLELQAYLPCTHLSTSLTLAYFFMINHCDQLCRLLTFIYR